MLGGHPESWAEVRAFLAVEVELNDDWLAGTTIRVFRFGQWVTLSRALPALLLRKPWWLIYHLWVELALGGDLQPDIQCGIGLRLAHGGKGVVIHPDTVIGERVTIYHRVTVGVDSGRPMAPVPVIGDDVTLGAGCAVVGEVKVGDGAGVRPNALIDADVAGRLLKPRPRQSNRGRTVSAIRRRRNGSR